MVTGTRQRQLTVGRVAADMPLTQLIQRAVQVTRLALRQVKAITAVQVAAIRQLLRQVAAAVALVR